MPWLPSSLWLKCALGSMAQTISPTAFASVPITNGNALLGSVKAIAAFTLPTLQSRVTAAWCADGLWHLGVSLVPQIDALARDGVTLPPCRPHGHPHVGCLWGGSGLGLWRCRHVLQWGQLVGGFADSMVPAVSFQSAPGGKFVPRWWPRQRLSRTSQPSMQVCFSLKSVAACVVVVANITCTLVHGPHSSDWRLCRAISTTMVQVMLPLLCCCCRCWFIDFVRIWKHQLSPALVLLNALYLPQDISVQRQ